MDVREKLVELLQDGNNPLWCWFPNNATMVQAADYLIANGVTVQGCKLVEIDQFKLPIDDAILILKEEHKQRVDGYTTYLPYGGKGDPAEEVSLDALEMAISALEKTKWISVKDRLPEKNREAVLIVLRWEETDIGWYDKDDKCWQSEFVNEYEDGEVTHWQYLPPTAERRMIMPETNDFCSYGERE